MTFPSEDTFPDVGLVNQADVEAKLLRPLTPLEAQYLGANIDTLVADLRSKMRYIDDRMAAWDVDPRPASAIDPERVRGKLASILKRYLTNTRGVASQSRGDGPFTTSESFASYGKSIGEGTPGELEITDGDIADLLNIRGSRTPSTIQLVVPRPRRYR